MEEREMKKNIMVVLTAIGLAFSFQTHASNAFQEKIKKQELDETYGTKKLSFSEFADRSGWGRIPVQPDAQSAQKMALYYDLYANYLENYGDIIGARKWRQKADALNAWERPRAGWVPYHSVSPFQDMLNAQATYVAQQVSKASAQVKAQYQKLQFALANAENTLSSQNSEWFKRGCENSPRTASCIKLIQNIEQSIALMNQCQQDLLQFEKDNNLLNPEIQAQIERMQRMPL